MKTYLLDSTIVSKIIKRDDQSIKKRFQQALRNNSKILISPIVFYEVMRFFYHKKAVKEINFLLKLVDKLYWIDTNYNTWDKGAKIWAQARSIGRPTADEKSLDADVLIAAQAKEHNAVVVTKNTKHFTYLGVENEQW